MGAANWSCPHPFPLRDWSRCSVACIPAATAVSRWSSCCPLDTTHLDPWVKRLSLLLLQSFPGGVVAVVALVSPCINLHPRSRLLSKRVYQGKQMSCQNGRTSCVLYIVVVLVDPSYMEVAPRSRRLSRHTRNSQTHTHNHGFLTPIAHQTKWTQYSRFRLNKPMKYELICKRFFLI